ncbi:8242_t:CDS:1, partial [Cetraspora pellucida]
KEYYIIIAKFSDNYDEDYEEIIDNDDYEIIDDINNKEDDKEDANLDNNDKGY